MLVSYYMLRTKRIFRAMIMCFCSMKVNSDGAISDMALSAQAQRALWASQWIQCIM